MTVDRIALIEAAFDALIADAEAELARAKIEHQYAMDRVVDPDDPDDAAYTAQERADTGAEVCAATAVADALIEARDQTIRAVRGAAQVPGAEAAR